MPPRPGAVAMAAIGNESKCIIGKLKSYAYYRALQCELLQRLAFVAISRHQNKKPATKCGL
jgi:hypothetical protein